jgi:hypothetical protein
VRKRSGLQKVVRDGGEHRAMMPAGKGTAFEVIQPQFGFELLIFVVR